MRWVRIIDGSLGQELKIKIFLWRPRRDTNNKIRWLEFVEAIQKCYISSKHYTNSWNYILIQYFGVEAVTYEWEIVKILPKENKLCKN
jgi:hypothetical protein